MSLFLGTTSVESVCIDICKTFKKTGTCTCRNYFEKKSNNGNLKRKFGEISNNREIRDTEVINKRVKLIVEAYGFTEEFAKIHVGHDWTLLDDKDRLIMLDPKSGSQEKRN
jgi:hypothetical protein